MANINDILTGGFSNLPLDDKIKIKSHGRPTPIIQLSQTGARKGKNRAVTRRFAEHMYYKNSWLCGCDLRKALFCFPCLLFYADGMDKTWSRTGFKDLKYLSYKLKKHQASTCHINCSLDLALLGKVDTAQVTLAHKEDIIKHNEQVKKNMHVLKAVINCVKFCCADANNLGIFKELVDFRSELDVVLKEHLKSAVCKETYETFPNDILDCMLTVCRDEIKKQIESTEFLAVQCDETSDISNHCQMVLILRYVHEGLIQERFWSFIRVKAKSADVLKKCIEEQLDAIISETPEKLIAQSYDVVNVPVHTLQAEIRKKYPVAHYVHSYAHPVNLLVHKAAEQHVKTRSFFSDLSLFPVFFSDSAHNCDVFQNIVSTKLPGIDVTLSAYNIGTARAVLEHQQKLMECFEEIEKKCAKNSTCKEARGLRRALQDPNFTMWLSFFERILHHVNMYFDGYQHIKRGPLFSEFEVFKTTISERIDDELDGKFLNDYDRTNRKRRRVLIKDKNSVIADKVCDVVKTQLRNRLSYRGHLEAAALVEHEVSPRHSKNFPTHYFCSVVGNYPTLVSSKLQTELGVVYWRDEFRNIGAVDMLTLLLQDNLEEAFSEMIKLIKIVITTPIDTTESGRCFLTSERVKTFLGNAVDDDRLEALAMLSINKDLVNSIENFDDKVIEYFVSSKGGRTEFTFKK